MTREEYREYIIDKALAPYVGKLSPRGLAIQRDLLRDAIEHHPELSAAFRGLEPDVMYSSSHVEKKPGAETEDDETEKARHG